MQPQTSAAPFAPALRAVFRTIRMTSLIAYALRVFQVHRQRRELANLSDKQLSDIGTTRGDARIEANRPFWDLPEK